MRFQFTPDPTNELGHEDNSSPIEEDRKWQAVEEYNNLGTNLGGPAPLSIKGIEAGI